MLSLIVTLIMGLWPSVSYINAAETETEASQESTDASVSGDNMTGNDVAETEMLSESTEVSATDDTSTSVNTAEMGTTYDESLVSSKSDDSLTNKTNWESLVDFSEGETYYIATASDLVKMAELVNLGRTGTGCSFLLTNDIDLSSVCAADTSGWVSIGNSAENCFGGIFDGNNFAIHNIYISSTETNYGGLFGYLSGATIKNLTLNGTLNATTEYSAAWAHTVRESIFEKCTNNVNITATGSVAGFVSAGVTVNFINCVNNGKIESTGNRKVGDKYIANGYDAAGFVLRSSEASSADAITLTGCKNTGDITSLGDACGLAHSSINDSLEFTNCTNEGAITVNNSAWTSGRAMGIVGSTYPNSALILKECCNYGEVTSTGQAAGIATGTTKPIEDCRNYGKVTANSGYAAGISSQACSGIRRCVNYAAISGKDNVGGLVGKAVSSNEDYGVADSYNFGEIKGERYVGGLVGYISVSNWNVISSYNRGNISEPELASDAEQIGGLVGAAASIINITQSYNSGNISTPNSSYVGGLVGCFSNSNGTVTISECYNAGSILAYDKVGGFVGGIPTYKKASPTIKNSYSVASMVSARKINGVVGLAIGDVDRHAKATGTLNLSNLFVYKLKGIESIGQKGDTVTWDSNTIIRLNYAQMVDSSFITHLGSAFAKFSTDIYGGQEYSESDWEVYKSYYGDYPYPILVSSCGASPLTETSDVQFLGAQYAKVTVNGYETYATTVAPGSAVSFSIETGDPNITVTSVVVGDKTLEATDGIYTCEIAADTFINVTLSGTMTDPDDGEHGEETEGYPISFAVTDGSNSIEGVQITVTGGEGTVYDATKGIYRLNEGSYSVRAESDGYHTVQGTLAVTSAMSKEETNIITFYLSPTSVQERTITMHLIAASVIDSMKVYSGDLLLEEKVVDSSDVSFTLPAGTYTYSSVKADTGHGSGPFTIADQDGDQTLTLRAMDMTTYGLSNGSNVGYTVTMKAADGREYFPGSLDAQNGGGARGWFLLPASAYGEAYQYAFLPISDSYWGSYGTTYLYSGYVNTALRNFDGLEGSQSDTGKFLIARKITASLTVPTGATLQVCHRVKFYEPLEIIEPTSTSVDGDQTTYTYDIPSGVTLHYELEMPGYVKKAATFTGAVNLTVTTADLTPASSAAADKADSIDSAVLTNAPDSHYIELGLGEQYELYLYRNWQATNSITGNYYVDPDYKIEVISGSSVSITDPYYAGARIQAVSEGVSVVRITYDALDFVDTTGSSYIYSKLYEKNTTVLIVNVGGNGVNVIDSGCGAAEYEIRYFIRSVNGNAKAAEDQYAKLTFQPSSNVSKVEWHAPVGSSDTWTDTWTDVPSNGDGTFTAHLTEGSNILRFTTADNIVTYHVVRAIGLDLTASSAENTLKVSLQEGEFVFDIKTNDELTIDFDGLQMPLPKLAALINPGLESVITESGGYGLVESTYAQYTLSGENTEASTVKGKASQYDISTKNALTLNFATPDTYTLSEGVLHTTSFGVGSYTGMTRGGYTGDQPTKNNGMNTKLKKSTSKFVYSALPDLKILATVQSDDVSLESVRVSGIEATAEGTAWKVELPYGSTISDDSSCVIVKATHELATVSTPVTADGGKTWTFTVTAENGC